MKKTKIAIAIALNLLSISTVYAGAMGPVASELPSMIPFASIEASYTWNQFDGININNERTSLANQGWGGRFAGGFYHPLNERVSLSGEVGGGYYGNTTPKLPLNAYSARFSIDGYDLLLGAKYSINQFDLFGKVGLMIENMRVHVMQNLSQTIPGGVSTGQIDSSFNQTQALPEIKMGGIYNLNDQWGFSLAYMHVFGANMKTTTNVFVAPGSVSQTTTQNMQNTTLNSVMFGLQYKFA